MRYLLFVASRPPYCYCYSAASCIPVWLKPYANWSCPSSCLFFLTRVVSSVRFNPSLTFLPYKVTFKPRPQEPKQCLLRCKNTSRSFTSCVMASSHRAPKQWCLSKVETINNFENWKQNMLYTLSLDSNFAPFLADGVQWLKKTKAQPLRGLEADGDSIPLARRLTARQKVNFLELMLGQIANYCPIISRSTLVKNSTSLEYIWQTIRQHFGFQATGAQFIDFSDIHLAADERPEDLYQRLNWRFRYFGRKLIKRAITGPKITIFWTSIARIQQFELWAISDCLEVFFYIF